VFDTFNGLPLHVLLIHAVIVLVPIAALMAVASAIWPAARARLGFLTPAVALVALVLVPITVQAGHWLRDHLGFTNAAVRKHTSLGGTLLPWVVGLFVLAVAMWVLDRRYELSWHPSTDEERAASAESGGSGGTATITRPARVRQALPVWVTVVVTIGTVAVAVGTLIQLYRIGDSGAKSVWSHVGGH
jgi:hypothetical protein